jgi:glucokinase
MPALVFDLGGTYLRCAVAADGGTLENVRKFRIQNSLDGAAAEDVWNSIRARLRCYHRDSAPLLPSAAPLVLAFPGPIDGRKRVLHAPTITGALSPNADFAAGLSDDTGRAVHLINDVSAAAWYISRTTPARRFQVVTVSSGIGSKIFDRDHPLGVIDVPPWAGEIGHIVVDPANDAPLCDCGARGHLGAVSSGRGVERLARRRASADPILFLQSACARSFGADAGTLTNEQHLVPAVLAGDDWSLDVVRSASAPLAQVLAATITVCGLDRVFLIGGFAMSLGDVYLAMMSELLAQYSAYALLSPGIRQVLELSHLYEDVCLHGAAVYAQQVLGAMNEARGGWR